MVTNKDLEALQLIKDSDNIVLVPTEVDGILCTAICLAEKAEEGLQLQVLAVVVNPSLFKVIKQPQ